MALKKRGIFSIVILFILIFMSITIIKQHNKLNELENIHSQSEARLISHFNAQHISYLFGEVLEEPSKQNIETLYNSLSNTESIIRALIELNKEDITISFEGGGFMR
ncbi:hypothetical protein [Gracilibacillus sp. YIM 98692]|uniref:hypothetical protein n=1 Tax=Gracilibacillus sp. YIM 98692 TaxID=2663532 RepID=UPI0013D6975A|nr:hypothetical protein [Gracilibacillus sp. YIM 98692]